MDPVFPRPEKEPVQPVDPLLRELRVVERLAEQDQIDEIQDRDVRVLRGNAPPQDFRGRVAQDLEDPRVDLLRQNLPVRPAVKETLNDEIDRVPVLDRVLAPVPVKIPAERRVGGKFLHPADHRDDFPQPAHREDLIFAVVGPELGVFVKKNFDRGLGEKVVRGPPHAERRPQLAVQAFQPPPVVLVVGQRLRQIKRLTFQLGFRVQGRQASEEQKSPNQKSGPKPRFRGERIQKGKKSLHFRLSDLQGKLKKGFTIN